MKIAADRASLAAEKISYGNAHISSPIAGTVYTVPVKQYDFVQMGADLLHVANLKKLAVRAVFYEPDIEQLRSGEPVAITWSGAPGHSWFGNIQTKPLAVSGDGVLRTAECTIEITSDTDGLPINTGVAVAATTNKHSHVLTLPREAVRTEGSRYFVYRVIDSLLKKTEVEIGLVTALKIEVTRGLRTDDRIALHTVGGGVLKDNLHIKAKGQSQLR
jgi:HlyD family secretion protein